MVFARAMVDGPQLDCAITWSQAPCRGRGGVALVRLDAIALVAFRRISEHQRTLNCPPEEPWYVQFARGGVAHLPSALTTNCGGIEDEL